MQATGIPYAKALTCRAFKFKNNRCIFHAQIAVALGNLPRQSGADRAIAICHGEVELTTLLGLNGWKHLLQYQCSLFTLIKGRVSLNLTELRLINRGLVSPCYRV